MEHDYDDMVELMERYLKVELMISTDDRTVLLEDDPTEVYQDDDKLLYFTQTSLLNSFNGRLPKGTAAWNRATRAWFWACECCGRFFFSWV